jgi:hypothetical protein
VIADITGSDVTEAERATERGNEDGAACVHLQEGRVQVIQLQKVS